MKAEELNCTADSMCKTMASRLNDPYTRAKGLRAQYTVNLKPNEERLLGVSYHTSAADKGLMLNTCPWCGGKPGYFERS
jgi:hypothetical protein